MYADILKQQFSCASPQSTTATTNNQPPHKWQATILDYDSDQLAKFSPPASNSNSHSCNSPPINTTKTPMVNYVAELLSLKTEVQVLHTLITTAVEQLKNEIASLHALISNEMETDAEHSLETTNNSQPNQNLPAIIAELKYGIATATLETKSYVSAIQESHAK